MAISPFRASVRVADNSGVDGDKRVNQDLVLTLVVLGSFAISVRPEALPTLY